MDGSRISPCDTCDKRGTAVKNATETDDLIEDLRDYANAFGSRSGTAGYAIAASNAADSIVELSGALKMFVAQWNACGPNSDFGRYFQNVKNAADLALKNQMRIDP
jgi:hypothetical protein